MAIAAAVVAGVFVPGQEAWAVPEVPAVEDELEPERGPDGLVAPDVASAQTIARLMGERVEVLGERTPTSSTWVLPDGTQVAGTTQAPVWVPVGDGDGTALADWTPVDLTLQVTDEGQVEPVAHPADLVLAGGGGVPESGALVTLSGGPDEAGNAGPAVSIAWEGELPVPELDGPRAIYEQVQPGVDLVVEATRTGYEQFFVLTEAPADPAALDLSLEMRTEGVGVTSDADGGVTFTDPATGVLLGGSGTPLVWDADVDAQRQHPITEEFVPAEVAEDALSSGMPAVPDYELVDAAADPGEPSTSPVPPAASMEGEVVPEAPAGAVALPLPGEGAPATGPGSETADVPPAEAGQAGPADAAAAGGSAALPLTESVEVSPEGVVTLDLVPDPEFLASADTVYPVVVDPEANFQWGFDTFVQHGFSTDQSGSSELRIGTFDGGSTVARSFLRVDVSAVRYTRIIEAGLYLWNFHSWSCTPANWEVRESGLAGHETRINNQPWAGDLRATTNATVGGGGCAAGWVGQDLTSLVQDWANGGGTVGGLLLKAQSETANAGWKKFNSAQAGANIPTLYVHYNAPPGPAGTLWAHPINYDEGWYLPTATPRLTAVSNDPDSVVNMRFEVRRVSDSVSVWEAWANAVAHGQTGSVDVPAGVMVEGGQYFIRVHTWDGYSWNTYPAQSGNWTVDTTAPRAPTIASTDYPADGRWYRGEGQAGAFTLTMPAADSTVSAYEWALDAVPSTRLAVTGGATTATLSVTPPTNGVHVLQVRTVDRAGNRSGITEYTFNVGRAGLLNPIAGANVVRRVQIHLSGEQVFTHAQFLWRRGPDATTFAPIDLTALAAPNGNPITAAWTPITQGTGAGATATPSTGEVTWDAGLTLGHVAGPVQVAARLATDATGANAYLTAWTTVTVDPDAAYAATDSVGPGSVNLLTGEYLLSATDVDEFGLAIGRTTSSRNVTSGLELQPERMTAAQLSMSDLYGWSAPGTNSTRVTDRFRTPPIPGVAAGSPGSQGDSIRVDPTGSTADTYLTPAPAQNLERGRTWRLAGWIYVPAGTGLTPDNVDWGQRLMIRYQKADGSWTHIPTPRPTITDAWQYLTVDVPIPADALSTGSVRLYSGMNAPGEVVFFDDVSVREVFAPIGPQWSLGTADGATGTAYTQVTQPSPDTATLGLSGGGEIWFTASGNGQWWPEPGGEALTLTQTGPGAWSVREIDGTVSLFATGVAGAPADNVARLTTTSPPAASGQTRLVYALVDGRLRLTRMIAPIQPGVDNWPTNTAACTTATPVAGCQVLELVYASSTTATAPTTGTGTSGFGDFAGQVSEIRLWSTDNGSAAATDPTTAVTAVRYAYDSGGRLRQAWDPRISPALKTTYAYDTDGRVTELTGAGELPWRFTYGTGGSNSTIGNGDLVDRSSGRLKTVTRASLQPGTVSALGPDVTSSVVYAVPLTRAAGGPYDLNAAALATWAQTRGPTDATAIFGPENPPGLTTATATAPGRDGYKPATVHYLDSAGREINTATPTGTDAPAAGFIDSAEYDRFGNVVRSLDATNRLLALGQLPTATADLAALNLTATDTATRAIALSTLTTYSPDGLDLLRTRGPLLRLAIGNNPGDVRLAHDVTTNVYDEGKPDGVAYHLLTTTTDAVLLAGSSPEVVLDAETTVNGYNPIDGASATGPTSGWVIGSPTVVTGDAGTGGANLVSRVRYDAQGRAVESRKVGSTGADAGTVRSVFYTAAANPDRAECGGKPAYAGLPCATFNAGATTGSDTARMATGLPVRTVSAYNRYGSIAAVTETATGPLAGATVTQTRTTTTTYDDADRVTAVAITTAGAGVTPAALPKTVTTYDPASGDVTAVSTVDAAGTVLARTEKVFDALGRMTSYTDAAGGVTTTTFDRYGKPVTVADSTGASTTFTYDRAVEPRGYVTSVADSVGGTISATYGPDGQVLTQTLPGGVQLRIGYDAARTPVSRTYVRTSDNAVISASAVVENGNGQWVSHTTSASTKTYAYDRLGRLTNVTDTITGIASCTSRAYTYGNRAERLTRSVNQSASSTCPTATGSGSTTTSYSYDSGDRLVSDSATGAAGWVYDPLGRIVDAPVASNPGARVQNAYWANDLIASQTIPNVARQTWTLDPLQRFSEFTSETWMAGAWQQAATKVNHYDSDSDSPAWITEDKSLPNEITRYVDGLDGSLAMQTGKTGTRVLQLIDLQGSVMTTLPIADGATAATWTGIRHQTSDEFGTPTDLTTGRARTSTGASPDKNNRYGWLGGAQRSTQALAGVTLMGVRLYDPNTGRFWSTDPVPGGNATTYDYCSGDPVNCTDLDGRWSLGGFLKKAVKVVAKVGEIASNIPGPIGTAAAGISAVAYAAQGNKSKALEMGLTAAANLVGAGSVVRLGARAIRAAGNVAARAGKAVSKAVKGCNSFVPDTGVLLADGTVAPIASISEGDSVMAMDPLTGDLSSQVVLNVIVGVGAKHLITVTTAPADDAHVNQNEQFADRGPGLDEWTATANHPIWVVGVGWTDAEDLAVGDRTRTASGEARIVVAVEDHGYVANQRVMNLTVANIHTFIVGDLNNGALVHNASVCSVFAPNAHRRPGVYSIHFSDGSSYVGRSVNVRARVNSHFTRGGKFYRDGQGRGEIVAISTRRGTVDVGAMRRAEQARMDRLRNNGRPLRNQRNEIARR